MVPQIEFFSFISLGELKTPDRNFEINWPLGIAPSLEEIIFYKIYKMNIGNILVNSEIT